ncbi:MAG: type III pantothenate kinase, partial [Desulfobacterales bacterium]
MLLTTNINNTNTMIGLSDGPEWIANWRIKTDQAKQPDEHAMLLRNLFQHHQLSWADVTGVALASVVPPLTATFVDMYQRYFHIEPLVVTNKIKTGVKIRIDYPAEAGADRILNALAAG